jgi:hypothetical protein
MEDIRIEPPVLFPESIDEDMEDILSIDTEPDPSETTLDRTVANQRLVGVFIEPRSRTEILSTNRPAVIVLGEQVSPDSTKRIKDAEKARNKFLSSTKKKPSKVIKRIKGLPPSCKTMLSGMLHRSIRGSWVHPASVSFYFTIC